MDHSPRFNYYLSSHVFLYNAVILFFIQDVISGQVWRCSVLEVKKKSQEITHEAMIDGIIWKNEASLMLEHFRKSLKKRM